MRELELVLGKLNIEVPGEPKMWVNDTKAVEPESTPIKSLRIQENDFGHMTPVKQQKPMKNVTPSPELISKL